MINLFDVVNKQVVPAAVCHLISELKAIIENYPDEYLKVLAYVFFTTCPDSSNPYLDQPENMREEVVIADLQPFKFSLEATDIALARDKCRMLFETPSLRIVQGAKMMLDEMARKLQSPLTFGKDGNATDMRGIMKEIRGYRQDYIDMENALKEEQAKVRGNLRLRYDQRPDYKNTKED